MPNQIDKDAAWAVKIDSAAEESDDAYSLFDDEDETSILEGDPSLQPSAVPAPPRDQPQPSAPVVTRERKSSLPLSAKHSIASNSTGTTNPSMSDSFEPPKNILKILQACAHEINALDSGEIAEEITRVEAKYFLAIEVRARQLAVRSGSLI